MEAQSEEAIEQLTSSTSEVKRTAVFYADCVTNILGEFILPSQSVLEQKKAIV